MNCGIVGCGCVCVCFFGRVGPKGNQTVSRKDVLLNLFFGLMWHRGADGVPVNQQKYKNKNADASNENNKRISLNAGRISKQMEGSTVRRLLWYYGNKMLGNK